MRKPAARTLPIINPAIQPYPSLEDPPQQPQIIKTVIATPEHHVTGLKPEMLKW